MFFIFISFGRTLATVAKQSIAYGFKTDFFFMVLRMELQEIGSIGKTIALFLWNVVKDDKKQVGNETSQNYIAPQHSTHVHSTRQNATELQTSVSFIMKAKFETYHCFGNIRPVFWVQMRV